MFPIFIFIAKISKLIFPIFRIIVKNLKINALHFQNCRKLNAKINVPNFLISCKLNAKINVPNLQNYFKLNAKTNVTNFQNHRKLNVKIYIPNFKNYRILKGIINVPNNHNYRRLNETWFPVLRNGHTLRVLENRIPRRTFGRKRVKCNYYFYIGPDWRLESLDSSRLQPPSRTHLWCQLPYFQRYVISKYSRNCFFLITLLYSVFLK